MFWVNEVLVRGWLVKRVLTRRGDSWALESTAAVVGDEEKLSKELFTGNGLFTVKGRLRTEKERKKVRKDSFHSPADITQACMGQLEEAGPLQRQQPAFTCGMPVCV
ncbi:hypothetical protein NQZ68_039609 [Dissostichus eleginoides]|nr:hypothetical protein NQZ68_039609 [Dissostichus eleginoides]